MSRVPLDHKPTPLLRIAEIYSKRRYGAVLEPGLALLHNRKVLVTVIANENRVARWDILNPTVKAVAALAAAAEIGWTTITMGMSQAGRAYRSINQNGSGAASQRPRRRGST